jgi:flagellar biosynthesis/type III secretory pathway protein FliH
MPGPAPAQRTRIAREEAEARVAAGRILAEASARADALVAKARADAEQAAAELSSGLAGEADAKLAARWLLLRREEQRALERSGDRMITLATVLAERLLDAALELGPERIVPLARQVIAEAGGARRAVVEAHPVDAEALRTHLADAAFDLHSVEVRESTALARGELRLHTDLGIIDARLAPRFDRLAAALRDFVD